MEDIRIRNLETSDFDAVVQLNEREVQHTSPMDAARLEELAVLARYRRVATVNGVVAAFLLAMRDDAAYQNKNFAWFRERFPSFLYVDRIVVSKDFPNRKLGSMLYHDVFDVARQEKLPFVVCEFNLVPPNEPSRAFHQKFGFSERGTQWLDNSTKLVSMQVAEVGE